MTKQELINRVNNDPKLLADFKTGWDRPSIEEYLEEYSYISDIVDLLADDLGIS